MTFYEEEKTRQFDDLITSLYINTNRGAYRLSMTFWGGFNEEDEEDPAGALGCDITLYTISGGSSATFPALAEVLEGMAEDVETGETVSYNSCIKEHPYISCENYDSFEACEDIKSRILDTLQAIEG
jgi:hypothetical protein